MPLALPTQVLYPPRAEMNTHGFRAHERLDGWRSLFEGYAELIDDGDREVVASVGGHHLGAMAVGNGHGPGLITRRERRHINRDTRETINVRNCRMPVAVETAEGVQQALPGDLIVSDLSQPVTHHFLTRGRQSYESLTILTDEIRAHLPPSVGPIGTRVLSGRSPITSALKTWLADLVAVAGRTPLADAPQIVSATAGLMAACLHPTAAVIDAQRDRIDAARRAQVRAHIEARLREPGLSADHIARACGLSRRGLDRLFEPMGGVVSYVWDRRLDRARAALIAPGHAHLAIGDIARGLGFANQAHFSDAMKRRFGVSPRALRLVIEETSVGDLTGEPGVTRLNSLTDLVSSLRR